MVEVAGVFPSAGGSGTGGRVGWGWETGISKSLLYKSSIKKVIPFSAAVEGVAPVGLVQLVKLLWLLVMLLHTIPGLEDLVPLLSGK